MRHGLAALGSRPSPCIITNTRFSSSLKQTQKHALMFLQFWLKVESNRQSLRTARNVVRCGMPAPSASHRQTLESRARSRAQTIRHCPSPPSPFVQEGQHSREALEADAMTIYNTYFSLQAPISHVFLQTLACMGPEPAERQGNACDDVLPFNWAPKLVCG